MKPDVEDVVKEEQEDVLKKEDAAASSDDEEIDKKISDLQVRDEFLSNIKLLLYQKLFLLVL